MMRRDGAYEVVRRRRGEHLAQIRKFLRQPSVSQQNPDDVRACARLVVSYLGELGCQAVEIVETPGLPAVWAEYRAGASRTLAVYSYFDTTVVGQGWVNNPYEAVLAERPPFPEVVYGRGAGSKGGLLAFIHALAAIREVEGELPLNVMFLCEGEEFLGSENIPYLIDRFKERLLCADSVLWPGPCQAANGDVTLFLGTKGCLKLEIECSGERWGRGPAMGPAHSSTQGVVDSPVWRLVHALATLYEPAAGKICVERFYEGLCQPTSSEQELLKDLAKRYHGQEQSAIPMITPGAKVERFVNDVSGYELFRRYCFEATMNIDGLRAGYTGPGTASWTLPNVAYCTIDHRLPLGLDPARCLAAIRHHLDKCGYPDIGLKTLMSVSPQGVALEDDIVQAAVDVFRRREIRPVIWPCKGTSGPAGYFNQLLGRSVLGSTAVGYASGFSGPNEFLVTDGNDSVGGLVEMEQSFVDLIYAYAARPLRQ